MINRRTDARTLSSDQAQAIESFGADADVVAASSDLDPAAKRDFKRITVPLNEYEYRALEALARTTGRTKLNALRWAVLELLENER